MLNAKIDTHGFYMSNIKREYEKDTIEATVDFVKSLGSNIREQDLVESYERILVENYPQHHNM